MKVLIACEESQRVCAAFRKFEPDGDIYSCDILPCSGEHPEWHIQTDVIPLLDGNCEFKTQDGITHCISGTWDLIIAHPPCTFLCRSGQSWCNVDRYGDRALERIQERDKAVAFFMRIATANCEYIAIENPVGIMSICYRKPDQYIRPCEFGHPTGKKTGLWLKQLPLLVPANIVEIEYRISASGKKYDKWFYESSKIWPPSARPLYRSKTFEGVAEAMAEQWYPFIMERLSPQFLPPKQDTIRQHQGDLYDQ